MMAMEWTDDDFLAYSLNIHIENLEELKEQADSMRTSARPSDRRRARAMLEHLVALLDEVSFVLGEDSPY